MPNLYSEISYRQGTASEYKSLQTKDPSSIYFLTDTHQIYVGDVEYTKSALTISSKPNVDDAGEEGRFYACTQDQSSYVYVGGRWICIYDPSAKVVKTINQGEGISLSPNPITAQGTVSHAIPSGACAIIPSSATTKVNLGESFTVKDVKTDKFGHVVGTVDRKITMPTAEELGTVFKFKGTVADQSKLPASGNLVGDVYYAAKDSSEFVYLQSGWEKLGPIVGMSGLAAKVPEASGYVAMFDLDGSVKSAGYKPASGVASGAYGAYSEGASISVPCISVDSYGRITSASNKQIEIADPQYVEDSIAWIIEQYLG